MKTIEEVYEYFKGSELHFVEYYKYKFTYKTEKDDIKLIVEYGGDADYIYRQSFSAIEILDIYDLKEFVLEIRNGIYYLREEW